MARLNSDIQSFLNGVSTQAPQVRLDSQGELQTNYIPDLENGMRKRPSTAHKASLGSQGSGDDDYWHTIERDTSERYVVQIADNDLKVFDLDGNEKTVNFDTRTFDSLDGATSATDGSSKQIYIPSGTTTFDVITTGISGDTVIIEESSTGDFAGEESTVSTITTNTTTAVSATSGYYYRAAVSSYSAGTIDAQFSWEDSYYVNFVNTPKGYAEAITVADYTFILNKEVTAAMRSDTKATPNPQGLAYVRSVSTLTRYQIKIDGTKVADYQVGDGSNEAETAMLSQAKIAGILRGGTSGAQGGAGNANLNEAKVNKDLYSDLISGSGGEWEATLYNSVIHIENANGTDFGMSVAALNEDTELVSIKDEISSFTLLPKYGPDGFTIKVTADPDEDQDDYYLEFDNGGDSNAAGVWQETLGYGEVLGLDSQSMPHLLVRESDGTFTFQSADWSDRGVGDSTSNPNPSFVGKQISNIQFHKNRLWLMADENAVGSKVGDYFNFFRTSVAILLDDDPIDVSSTERKVSLIKHSVSFDGDLYVWTPFGQFALAGGDVLTPRTVTFNKVSAYRSADTVSPQVAKGRVYFADNRKDDAAIYEYLIDADSSRPTAVPANDHAAGYVPTGVTKLVAPENLGHVFILTDGDQNALYVYSNRWLGNKRVQAAMHKWDFGSTTKVLHCGVIDTTMHLILDRSDGLFLETLELDPAYSDFTDDLTIYLDRRVELSSGSYSAGSDETTYTISGYDPDGTDIVAVIKDDGSSSKTNRGFEETVKSTGANEVVLDGDTSGHTVYFGYTYESRYRLSNIFVRRRNYRTGAKSVLRDGVLKVLRAELHFDKTWNFYVEVTPLGRSTFTYTYEGQTGNKQQVPEDEIVPHSQKIRFPVKARNDRVTIDIINDGYFPSAFTALHWWGIYNNTGSRPV